MVGVVYFITLIFHKTPLQEGHLLFGYLYRHTENFIDVVTYPVFIPFHEHKQSWCRVVYYLSYVFIFLIDSSFLWRLFWRIFKH